MTLNRFRKMMFQISAKEKRVKNQTALEKYWSNTIFFYWNGNIAKWCTSWLKRKEKKKI